MNQRSPKLIALAGPLRGATYEIRGKEFFIGRDPSSDLPINDHLASRTHALITRKDDRIELNDLDSSNGVMVNNSPVKKRRLEQCDQIAIGNSLFLLLLHDEETRPPFTPARPAHPAYMDDGETTLGVTTLLRQEEALYLHLEKALAAASPTDAASRDVAALLKISLAIDPIHQSKELLRRLLELIFDLIPAEQGAILLLEDTAEEEALSVSLDRKLGRDQQIKLSRTVVERVCAERLTVWSDDLQDGGLLEAAPSLLGSQTRSLLASPLLVFEKAIGVVYLITGDQQVRFNRDHQQLLMAITSLAASKLEIVWRSERLEAALKLQRAEMREMIGESKPMRRLGKLINKIAPSDATVLIRGESGTGKELAARAIHRHSLRAGNAFVAVNCAALHQGVFESELFGHERGAFTGAVGQKRGLFEAADGGVIFLDEIGELSLALQAKLLRALQEREFLRVGGVRPIKVNVRVVAATNRDLEKMVKDESFREDLYYRLNVFPITLPPLRERREDVVLLARYFLRQFCEACKRPIRGFTQPALACLARYDWPGNVRELANAVERAVAMCEGEFIHPFDLPETIGGLETPPETAKLHLPTALKETKRRLILESIEQTQGNLTAAAKLLGVDAANLHRLVRDLELKPQIDKLIHGFRLKPVARS